MKKSEEILALLKTRFHGAANIRGIRFQILYSLLRAIECYAHGGSDWTIRLEGVEDVDLLGLHIENEYVQVKTSEKPWSWSKLKEPIQNFLPVYRSEPNSSFLLAFNFELKSHIAKLAQISSLPPKEQKQIENKFRDICRKIGASSGEANAIMGKLRIISIPEDEVLKQLMLLMTDVFSLGSQAAETYLLAFVAKFLEWAEGRKVVSRADIGSFQSTIGEALSRETEFQAYGRGLIDKISWEPDATLEDFLEGKGTRPGHISANIDVRRQTWLERIDIAIMHSKVCVIRSSSGQGKSTLMYRYAYEEWPEENTFVLHIAESQEHVETVLNYLRFRTNIGLPVLLLIDNADWRTKSWPFIAKECAALGIRVLITTRNEDWYRFARESLTSYEVVDPVLDLQEARDIFKVFRDAERLHSSINSPEWAYEKIGEPKLLIEYVYLLTHGRMLEERLSEQIKQFAEQGEDPVKVEVLRRTTLADAFGTPLRIEKLLEELNLREDPQHIIKSLVGEYVSVDDEFISGLHWVRSDHLIRILHDGYPSLAKTALSTIDAVPEGDIARFVSNAICREELDGKQFVSGLIEKARNSRLKTILAFLDGIFEAGERLFFIENKDLFDEAYELIGPAGYSLLSTDFLPIVKIDTIEQMTNIFKDEKGENFRKLKEISSRASDTVRGLDLCRDFLNKIAQSVKLDTLEINIGDAGRILDWCFLCNVNLPNWPNIKNTFANKSKLFDLPLDEFCYFSQGLYRFDEPTHRNWFFSSKKNILAYLKLQTDCIELVISNNEVHLEFFQGDEDSSTANEQAVTRLNKLRSAIPFCERYQSQGIWLLPFGLKPSVDETHKYIPKENLPFESDIIKNVVFRKVVESNYSIDSYYLYERAWYNLRSDALKFVKALLKGAKRALEGKSFDFQRAFENGELPVRLANSIKFLPDPPAQTPLPLKELLGKIPNKWSSSFRNFFNQFVEYQSDKSNNETSRLAVNNFLNATKYLHEIHDTFSKLFEITPDYFNVIELNASESKAYHILADLLDAWLLNPPKTTQRDILKYIKLEKEWERKDKWDRLKKALAPLEDEGITVILPNDLYLEKYLSYLPLAFSVTEPCYLYEFEELGVVVDSIIEIKDIADFFCFIPICKGRRFIEGGFQFSSHQISKFEDGSFEGWETLVPLELSEGILNQLPPLPFRPSEELNLQGNLMAIIGLIRSLAEWGKKFDYLKTSTDHFEVELYNRQTGRLRNTHADLYDAATGAKNILIDHFSFLKDDTSYKIIDGFIEAVRETSQHNTIDGLITSKTFKFEDIEESLEELLQLKSISTEES